MYPYISIGSFTFGTYGLCAVLAYICARQVFRADLVRHGFPRSRAGVIFLIVTPAGFVGAKLYHLLQDPANRLADPLGSLVSSPGLAWLGGLLAGAVTLALLALHYKMPVIQMFDLASPMAALAYAIGRIGCLLAGDGCYGTATSLPWGMRFPHALVPTMDYVHPTPIYEFLVNVGISCYLWRFSGRPQPKGAVFATYLVLSGTARFLVEFLRRNPAVYFGMSNAQTASLLCVVLGLAVAAASKLSVHPRIAADLKLMKAG